MSRKWWSIIVEFVLVVCFFVHSLAVSFFDDDDVFYLSVFICFYLVFFIFMFLRYVCFYLGLVWYWRELLFCRRFLSFVSCGSGGGIDMITNTFLAQSFLTLILRVGVCVIVSLIFTRVLAHGFCRAR